MPRLRHRAPTRTVHFDPAKLERFRWVLPTKNTAILCTVLLVLTLATGIPIAYYATRATLAAFFAVAYGFILIILVFPYFDPRKRTKLSANVFNTITVAFLAILIFPILWYCIWHPARTTEVLKVTDDIADSMRFPSFALLQRVDWSSQADLTLSPPPKCFLGWYNDASAPCESNVANSSSCMCAGGWNTSIDHDYSWQGVYYKVLSFTPSEALVSTRPTLIMTAQAFFYYNRSASYVDSSRASSPGLWIAMHDPTLTIYQALEQNNTQLKLIDANAEVAINLGISLQQRSGQDQAYYTYQPDISTVPALDLVCDISNGYNSTTWACYVNLLIQFPTFRRTTVTSEPSMSWVDVVVEAGAWFSFFQIVGWILSGSSMRDD